MSENNDELDALIEEFLDYCDLIESGATGVGLKFDTSIAHLEREQRRQVLQEFMRFTGAHFEPNEE